MHSCVTFVYCFSWVWSGKRDLRREVANSKGDLALGMSAYTGGYVGEAFFAMQNFNFPIKKQKKSSL